MRRDSKAKKDVMQDRFKMKVVRSRKGKGSMHRHMKHRGELLDEYDNENNIRDDGRQI